MNEQFISWIIILEVALPFVVLSLILTWVIISAKKKNKAAVRALILRIKNNEQSQKDLLLDFLTNKLGIEAAQAKKSSKKIINERKFLFRNLISVLLDKNMNALVELEDDLSRITKHYHQLDVQKTAAEPVEEVEEAEEEGASIDDLKQEIKTLKHEVHITLTTLNNIFGEFSSMFGEQVPDTEMSVDQIITAMESFSGKTVAKDGEDEILEEMDDLDEPDAFAELDEEEDDSSEAMDEPQEIESIEEMDSVEEMVDENVSEVQESESEAEEESEEEAEETLDFSIDSELDDIDSALDELELGASSSDDEPSWDDAFAESGDEKPDEK